MKRSYKLLGLFWDHMTIAKKEYPTIPNDPSICPVGAEGSLYDSLSVKRFVCLSSLLSIESEIEMADLALGLANCDTAAVLIDFIPSTAGWVQLSFFELRASQAVNELSRRIPGVNIVLMNPPSFWGAYD